MPIVETIELREGLWEDGRGAVIKVTHVPGNMCWRGEYEDGSVEWFWVDGTMEEGLCEKAELPHFHRYHIVREHVPATPNQHIVDKLAERPPIGPAEVYAAERMVACGRELLQLGRSFLDRMSGLTNQEEPHVPADKFPLSPEQLAQCQEEPEAREWEIWAEGFQATGESGVADLVGVGYGETWSDAVRDYYKRNPSSTFDPVNMTDWGRGLFPTEAEARRNFG